MSMQKMQSVVERAMDPDLVERVSLKVSHLFSMKERQRSVIGDFLSLEILNFNAPKQEVEKYGLTYRLGIIGEMGGFVLLNLSPKLAEKIACTLFATESVNAEDTHTAMQELLNIFSGHLATAFNELGIDFDITTPEPVTEDFLKEQSGRRIVFRFICENEILQFVLILKA